MRSRRARPAVPAAARDALQRLHTALGHFDASAAASALADLDRTAMPAVTELAALRDHIDSYEYDEARALVVTAARADACRGVVTIRKPDVAAPATAAALIAQQVAGNAIRDGLVLSLFPVKSLPYFMVGAAVLAIAAARMSGRLLGAVRPAPGRARLSRIERGAVRRRMGDSRLGAAGGGGAPVSPLVRDGRHCHLVLLVAAQRALRSSFSQAADGEGGGCRHVRRPRRRPERRACGRPSAARQPASDAGRPRCVQRRRRARGRTRRARPGARRR